MGFFEEQVDSPLSSRMPDSFLFVTEAFVSPAPPRPFRLILVLVWRGFRWTDPLLMGSPPPVEAPAVDWELFRLLALVDVERVLAPIATGPFLLLIRRSAELSFETPRDLCEGMVLLTTSYFYPLIDLRQADVHFYPDACIFG